MAGFNDISDGPATAETSDGSWTFNADGLLFLANDGRKINSQWPECDCNDEDAPSRPRRLLAKLGLLL
jgi:hypothetical protein